MVKIDRRKGSGELIGLFPQGVAELDNLEYADFCFFGNGPDGRTWNIGIERKRLDDFLNSAYSGRLQTHQLIGLKNSYNIVYIILEGIWRAHRVNHIVEVPRKHKWVYLEHGRRRYLQSEIEGFLNSLEMCCGVYVKKTATKWETVELVKILHHWWTSKEWADHHSYQQLRQLPDNPRMSAPTLIQQMAAQLPGIGWVRSEEVSRVFKTPLAMCLASEKDWREVPGIGKDISRRVVKAIQEGG